MNNLISISNARSKLPELVSKISKNMGRTTITVKGQPKVVLLSSQELDSLEETLEILSDKKLMKDIRQGEEDIKNGKGIPLEDFIKELGLNKTKGNVRRNPPNKRKKTN